MADQLTEPPYDNPAIVPPALGWKPLLKLDGAALEDQYATSIEKLGNQPGMLGVIFKGARCDIHNPALLKQIIVNLIDKEDWLSLPVDVKGTIYEELLARSASESTKGAGQYFTPRAVIQTMVEVMHKRKPTWSDENPDGHWRSYSYEEIAKRDKLSLDLFWIRDQSLTDTDSLAAPDLLATEIAGELEAAFEMFSKIAAKLPKSDGAGKAPAK